MLTDMVRCSGTIIVFWVWTKCINLFVDWEQTLISIRISTSQIPKITLFYSMSTIIQSYSIISILTKRFALRLLTKWTSRQNFASTGCSFCMPSNINETMAYSSAVCYIMPTLQTVIGVAIVWIETLGLIYLWKNSWSTNIIPTPELKQYDSRLKKFSVLEKDTILVVYFYSLNLYLILISWFRFIVDIITFCMFELKVVNDNIGADINESDIRFNMGDGGDKKGKIIIVFVNCILYLQLSICGWSCSLLLDVE